MIFHVREQSFWNWLPIWDQALWSTVSPMNDTPKLIILLKIGMGYKIVKFIHINQLTLQSSIIKKVLKKWTLKIYFPQFLTLVLK